MAKKKNRQETNAGNLTHKVSSVHPAPSRHKNSVKRSTHLFIAAAIAIITWLILKACLDNRFSWDDAGYLTGNALIKNISAEGFRNIFSSSVMGNYHPLTILSYAVEYSYVQLDPWLYHFDNLIFHILTTILVYWFMSLLTRRTVAAIVTALLFGLHPMHVESVAWASGRKDVLYGLFYMAACISYVYYLRTTFSTQKWGWYTAVIVLFVLSLLSKPVAVTLPVTLLLIDYFEKRHWEKRLLPEKIPHFILAIIFGIIAIKMQHSAGAMDMHKVAYGPLERIALGAYALITYLWKAILPAGLHNLYPYPPKVNGHLPYLFALYPLIIAAVIFTVWKYAGKNRPVVFGLLFFIANIILLLQFIPVGDAIVAERYTYIPYLGLFFIIGWFVSGYFEQGGRRLRTYIVLAVCLVYIGALAYLSNERCQVWYDEMTLWRDEIEKEPVLAPLAYNNLGYSYYTKWAAATDPNEKKANYDSAYYLINKAIELQPTYINPYVALGEMLRSARQYDDAKKTYYRALQVSPKENIILSGLAILYFINKEYDSSGYYFRTVMQLYPTAEAYGNYAIFLETINKNDSALIEYNEAIVTDRNNNYVHFLNRAKLFKKMNRWNEARKDIDKAITMDPEAGEPYYIRSFCDTQMKNKNLALWDVEKAVSLGYRDVDNAYYQELKK